MKFDIQERMLLTKINDANEDIVNNYALTNLYFSALSYHSNEFIVKSLIDKRATKVVLYEVFSSHAILAEFETFTVVIFRGFSKLKEFKMLMKFWKKDFFDIKAHAGFVDRMQYILYQLIPDLKNLQDKKRLIYTGHSMGGALAMLLAVAHRPSDICVFGCPKVSSGEIFKNYYKNVNILRMETTFDFVTWMPPALPFMYEHVGSVQSIPGVPFPIKTHRLGTYAKSLL